MDEARKETAFGNDFIWGVASSALQTEGSLQAEGRGPSIWDEDYLAAGPGDDSYEKTTDDILLLRKLGVNAYRFSLSWTRLFPDGEGPINERGAIHYLAFVKSLLANGITPYVTLFHWDYPLALEQKGGWLNERSPAWFENYARTVGKLFNGLVTHYITLNEPQCFLGMGHLTGVVPPHHHYDGPDFLKATHHVLLASGLATRALRAASDLPLSISLANTYVPSFPSDPTSPRDIKAAAAAYLSPEFNRNAFSLSLYADPAFLGHYDPKWTTIFDPNFHASSRDLEMIQAGYDAFGVNIYFGYPVKDEKGKIIRLPQTTTEKSLVGWPIEPLALYYGPKFLFERYHKPILITENGIASFEKRDGDAIHDPQRINYLVAYLSALLKAKQDGVPILGYFYWSLLDNFEWEKGYLPRFGLTYVDYAKEAKRLPKDSFYFFKKVIETKGQCLDSFHKTPIVSIL